MSARNHACPICGKPKDKEVKPFCSKRCEQVDLGRWFAGSYAVPVAEEDSKPEEEPEN